MTDTNSMQSTPVHIQICADCGKLSVFDSNGFIVACEECGYDPLAEDRKQQRINDTRGERS